MPYAHIAAFKGVQIAYTPSLTSHRSTHSESLSGSIAILAALSMDLIVLYFMQDNPRPSDYVGLMITLNFIT